MLNINQNSEKLTFMKKLKQIPLCDAIVLFSIIGLIFGASVGLGSFITHSLLKNESEVLSFSYPLISFHLGF
jgi:uncharacterized integral membrane protein